MLQTQEAPSLARQIQGRVRRGELRMPPLPELASRVMELLRDEDGVDARHLNALIEKDPAMTASILKMANSAAFGGLRAVSDLDHAVARLGVRQVGYVVTAVVHKGHFASKDPARLELLRQLWDHAVATALAAKQLAANGGGDRGEAFLAGLLHDTGKLLVLKGLDDLEKHAGAPVPPLVVENLIELLHPELGHGTLTAWRIAEPICRVALHHHDEQVNPSDALLLRVQAANAIARKMGAHTHPEPDLCLESEPSVRALGVDQEALAKLMVELEDQVAEVHRLF